MLSETSQSEMERCGRTQSPKNSEVLGFGHHLAFFHSYAGEISKTRWGEMGRRPTFALPGWLGLTPNFLLKPPLKFPD